jgi:hypothetical protein
MSEQFENLSSDEGVLGYTQRLRRELVGSMTAERIPEDNKDRITLLRALADMDAQELGKMKIDAKEKSTSMERAAGEMLATLLTGQLRDVNPYLAAAGQAPVPRKLPELDISDLALVRGETAVGVSSDNLTAMAQRTGMRLDSIPGAGAECQNLEFAPQDADRRNGDDV